VPVLGAAGAVAAVLTVWAGVHSPVLVNPGPVGLWRGAIVASYLAVGVYTWWRQPESWLGPVVTGVGFLQAATSLVGSGAPLVHTVGMVVWATAVVCSAYMYLCYPSGRLETRLERRFMFALGLSTVVVWGLILALSPSLPAGGTFVDCGKRCPPNALQLVSGHGAAGAALATAFRILFVISSLGVAMLVFAKARSSSRLRRRAIEPLAVVIIASVAEFVIALLLDPVYPRLAGTLRLTNGLLLLAIPFVILAGQIRGDVFAAMSLGQVAIRANGKPLTPATVQKLLADALGDSSLRLALWSPEHSEYVDVDGAPLTLSDKPAARSITWVTRKDQAVAALVHDPALDTDSTVVEGLAATSLLLLDNARLVEELRASRSRIVDAGQRERRRLERDLHDGAQAQLVAIQIRLELARELSDPAQIVEQIDEAQSDLDTALEEIRALAHGIYPAELQDLGLASALRSLACRSPAPIHVVDEGIGRSSAAIEAAIYFCAREAIQNAAKHAGTRATVTVRLARRRDALTFTVSDDGIGIRSRGDRDGIGIAGMRDRVEAVGGTLEIVSADGGGTQVRGTIPCPGSSHLRQPQGLDTSGEPKRDRELSPGYVPRNR